MCQFRLWHFWGQSTVYPKKYAHGYCFAVLCCGYTLTDFPISIRLTSLALWQSDDCPSASKATLMYMDKYFMWIHYDRLHNHNKAKHNKTVCIFLGIYCTSLHPYLNALIQMAMLYVWLPLSQWKCWPQFYQTRSAWSMDQGSTRKHSAVQIVDRRVIFIWSLIHGSSWSGLIKVGPGLGGEHDNNAGCSKVLWKRTRWPRWYGRGYRM